MLKSINESPTGAPYIPLLFFLLSPPKKMDPEISPLVLQFDYCAIQDTHLTPVSIFLYTLPSIQAYSFRSTIIKLMS